MSYTLRLATEATRDLVVEALRAEAGKRTRVAVKASLTVAEDKIAKRDVRSASVRVTALLAEAAQLGQLADELAAAEAIPVIDLSKLDDPTPLDVAAAKIGADYVASVGVSAPSVADEEAALDDGLSDAARAAMAQAEEYAEQYLADPDGEDVETGATAEDEPGDDVEEALKP